jgi:hypothetical protein
VAYPGILQKKKKNPCGLWLDSVGVVSRNKYWLTSETNYFRSQPSDGNYKTDMRKKFFEINYLGFSGWSVWRR